MELGNSYPSRWDRRPLTADAQRLQQSLREKVEMLTARDHPARMAIVAFSERMEGGDLREASLSQSLQDLQKAAKGYRAKSPTKGPKRADAH